MPNQTLLGYFMQAGPVVKLVMLLLLVASVISWTVIFQRLMFLRRERTLAKTFEESFWSGSDLTQLFNDLKKTPQVTGLSSIFFAGFQEFIRLRSQIGSTAGMVMEGVQRAMRIANAKEMEKLELHLPFLATVGSTSPYVGLFGTVWGIMASFQSLGGGGQLTIAMVAPGISEALVATAMGLFAAIPAVIGFNRFSNDVEQLRSQYDTFQEEFYSILYRNAHEGESVEGKTT